MHIYTVTKITEYELQPTFNNDLEAGQLKEFKLMLILDKKGFTTTSTSSLGKFSGYDIAATKHNQTYYIECKYDRKSTSTDNVAIELWTNTPNGKKRSGLSITTANVIAYSFPNDANFYLIQTAKLKELCKTCKDIRTGGDRNRISMAIIRKDVFLQHCYTLNDKPKQKGIPL